MESFIDANSSPFVPQTPQLEAAHVRSSVAHYRESLLNESNRFQSETRPSAPGVLQMETASPENKRATEIPEVLGWMFNTPVCHRFILNTAVILGRIAASNSLGNRKKAPVRGHLPSSGCECGTRKEPPLPFACDPSLSLELGQSCCIHETSDISHTRGTMQNKWPICEVIHTN